MDFLHNSQFFFHSEDKGRQNIKRGERKLGAKLGSKLGCKSWSEARFASQLRQIGPTWHFNLIQVGTKVGAQVGTKLGYRESP